MTIDRDLSIMPQNGAIFVFLVPPVKFYFFTSFVSPRIVAVLFEAMFGFGKI